MTMIKDVDFNCSIQLNYSLCEKQKEGKGVFESSRQHFLDDYFLKEIRRKKRNDREKQLTEIRTLTR